jgi:hypothetical protein
MGLIVAIVKRTNGNWEVVVDTGKMVTICSQLGMVK